MKKKGILILIICVCCIMVAAAIWMFAARGKSKKDNTISIVQKLDYSDDLALTYNPDQGFYRSKVFNVLPKGIFYDDGQKTAAQYDFNHYENQLYHLRMDISAFSGKNNGSSDLELTPNALADLDTLLGNLKHAQKNAVIRFCYCPDFGDAKDKEPSLDMIKKHIAQISSVLNKYESTITAIEAGMIGRWGEMNGSAITKDSAVVNAVLSTWLDCTNNLPILTRQPQHIYDFLGLSYQQAMEYSIESDNDAFRLGIFDDSFLGNNSDLGTFNHDRVQEIEWISKQTAHLPFGGEASCSSEDEALHRMEDGCLDNMKKLHLSYLNYHYNEKITDYWKNQTYSAQYGDDSTYYGISVYDYIAKHFGYRFVLTKSTFHLTNSAKTMQEISFCGKMLANLTEKT